VDGQRDSIAAIDVAIRVEVQLPVFYGTPTDLQLETVAGVSFARDFLVETIEQARSDQWIQGLEFTPGDLVSWRLLECQEKSIAGTELIRRTYRFEAHPVTARFAHPTSRKRVSCRA
jgi:hypothetical protein